MWHCDTENSKLSSLRFKIFFLLTHADLFFIFYIQNILNLHLYVLKMSLLSRYKLLVNLFRFSKSKKSISLHGPALLSEINAFLSMCYHFETVLEILYSIQISIFQYLTNQGDKIPYKWSGNSLLFHFMEKSQHKLFVVSNIEYCFKKLYMN